MFEERVKEDKRRSRAHEVALGRSPGQNHGGCAGLETERAERREQSECVLEECKGLTLD